MNKIYDSFAKMTLMHSFGASLTRVEKGEVEITMPFNKNFCQQHGFTHAGVITALVDTACGYAALTQMGEEKEVLTIEFKSNFLSPALGDKFIAVGKVVKAGRSITVTSGEVYGETNGERKLISMMQATMMSVEI